MKFLSIFFFLFCVSCNSAIVNVRVKSENLFCNGTGFFVTQQYIITAYHVIKKKLPNKPIQIRIPKNGIEIVLTATVVEIMEDLDIVVLRLNKPISIIPLKFCKNISVNDSVKAYRKLPNIPVEIKYGKIYRILPEKLFTTIVGKPGFSGSPIVRIKDNCVVGIARAILTGQNNNIVGPNLIKIN